MSALAARSHPRNARLAAALIDLTDKDQQVSPDSSGSSDEDPVVGGGKLQVQRWRSAAEVIEMIGKQAASSLTFPLKSPTLDGWEDPVVGGGGKKVKLERR